MLKFTLYPALPCRALRADSTSADKALLAGMPQTLPKGTGIRHFVKWCLVCVLVFCSGSVFAANRCYLYSGGNFTADIGTVSIPPDATLGAVVISKKVPPGAQYSITCETPDSPSGLHVTFATAVEPVSGYTNVYPTNLPGLGVRYSFAVTEGDGCGRRSAQQITNRSYVASCTVPVGGFRYLWEASTEYVKTGPIAGGALTSIPEVTVKVSADTGGNWTLASVYTGTATGTVITPTCTTPDVVIPMGNVNFSTFNRAGVVNDKWNNATFRVDNCPAGLNRVSIKFDTPTAGWLDDTNGVFKLNSPTDAATAKGIGIQMSFGDNNALAVYGSAQTLNGYDAYKTTGGSFTVPIGARYVKPASTTKLVAGQANGSVAFIMSYE